MTDRRKFLGTLGAFTAATAASLSLDPNELRAATLAARSGEWDTSWIDKVRSVTHRVVFNAGMIADGAVFDLADSFYAGTHDAEGASDADCRAVFVFRHGGTSLGFNDAMWAKYPIGEHTKVTDSATGQPARRNIYWTSASGTPGATKLVSLTGRGAISLICNVATHGVASVMAQQTGGKVDDVYADLKANLVPGAILVPSGIYALIRAQNAGCAFMLGT